MSHSEVDLEFSRIFVQAPKSFCKFRLGARGVFLRGQNHDRSDEFKMPEPIALGLLQQDSFASHAHPHSHTWAAEKSGFAAGCGPAANMQRTDFGNSSKIGTTHDATLAGGTETRPKSLIVNTYIKINRTSVENTQTQILTETLETLPIRILENERLRGVIREMVREEAQRLNTNAAGARAGNAR